MPNVEPTTLHERPAPAGRCSNRESGHWLEDVLRKALRASLLSSLSAAVVLELGACGSAARGGQGPLATSQVTTSASAGASGSGGYPGSMSADAGASVDAPAPTRLVDAGSASDEGSAALPGCTSSEWLLADGLHLARVVDYVADRSFNRVISSRGTACAGAADADLCLRELMLQGADRQLQTTETGVVRMWDANAAKVLLGPIDSVSEALWLLAAGGYSVPCDAKLTLDDDGYTFDRASHSGACDGSDFRWQGTAFVDRQGVIAELTGTRMPSSCSIGRRPEGLRSTHLPGDGSRLGEHFAAMAHLEAASVPAFSAIARELAHHGAPQELRAAALRARRDEVLHAQLTAAMARLHGAQPTRPAVCPTPIRSLECLALDNAIEGCVYETYAALEASHQAEHAQEPVVRAVMRRIAADEARHAALAWEIARFVAARLDGHVRSAIREQQLAAVDAIGARLRTEVAPDLCEQAGLPDTARALVLHRSLCATLWHGQPSRALV